MFDLILGLAILVNTCCLKTQEHYTKFCAHVSAVATLDRDLVPVTNRYEVIESHMNSFMHGYVLDIPNSCAKNACVYFFTVYLSPHRPLSICALQSVCFSCFSISMCVYFIFSLCFSTQKSKRYFYHFEFGSFFFFFLLVH